MLVRCDDRGLGVQTYEAWRHLRPHATVVVDMSFMARPARPLPQHPDRYTDRLVARFDGEHFLNYEAVLEHLAGCDVVFSCETFYDWRLIDDLRCRHVGTVIQGNPEFWRAGAPEPTQWWWPTPWRPIADQPEGPIVPVPIPDDAPAPGGSTDGGPMRVLFPGGLSALADRNGSAVFAQALRQVRSPLRARYASQDAHVAPVRGLLRQVAVERLPHQPDRWSMFADVDLVVIPRRYGGLCLPAQEAFAAGCAVAMTDVEPNRWWPTIPIRCAGDGAVKMPAGRIPVVNASAAHLATLIDRFAGDRAALDACTRAGAAWADAHRWSALLPLYESRLGNAAYDAA